MQLYLSKADGAHCSLFSPQYGAQEHDSSTVWSAKPVAASGDKRRKNGKSSGDRTELH